MPTGEVDNKTGLVLNDEGRPAYEAPDPTPMQPPFGYKRHVSMWEQMRAMMRQELANAEAAGFESPEEADDFEVGDDYDPTSPYEHSFDPPADPAPISPSAGPGPEGGSTPPPGGVPGSPAQPPAPTPPPPPPAPPGATSGP